MQKLNKKVFFGAVRQFIYCALILAMILFLRLLSYYYKETTFAENGVVENMQLMLLGLSAVVFGISGFKYKRDKALFFLFSSLALFACCRELDWFGDQYIPFISWKFAYIFPIAALIYVYKNRASFVETLNYFLTTHTFFLMVMAVVIAIPVAQAVGDKRLVTNVLGLAQMREIKEFFEEVCELIGYFTLFLASFESYFYWKKEHK